MKQIEKKFALTVPSSTENLALIREFVGSIAQQSGMDAADTGKLELAVDEACANVIEHAYGNDTTKEVIIRARLDDEALSIDVEDTGRGFDPQAVKQDNLDEMVQKRRTGGLGMRLMQTLMDEVRYEIEPGKKNELHMVKKLKKK